jgi:hypothetical protein
MNRNATMTTGLDDDGCMWCGEPNDNGEGYDGFCGNCADRIEVHNDGNHADGKREDCPNCEGMDVQWV